MPRLIRCPDGHVFDSEAHTACPHCSQSAASPDETPAASTPLTATGQTQAAAASVAIPISWLIGGGAALAVVVGAFLLLAGPEKIDTAKTTTPPRLAVADTKVVPPQPESPKNPPQVQLPPSSTVTPPQNQTPPVQPPQLLPPQQPPATNLVPPPGNVVPTVVGTNHAEELTDWGIPAQLDIQEDIGSRTPMRLPGGRRITTEELPPIAAKSMLIDVLDGRGHATLPGAVHMPGGGNYGRGRYNDTLQRNLQNALAKVTNRNPDYPLVFFCQGAQCWESYNAALRAIHMGYRNVMWYRGGLASWKAAGLPLQSPIAVYRIRG